MQNRFCYNQRLSLFYMYFTWLESISYPCLLARILPMDTDIANTTIDKAKASLRTSGMREKFGTVGAGSLTKNIVHLNMPLSLAIFIIMIFLCYFHHQFLIANNTTHKYHCTFKHATISSHFHNHILLFSSSVNVWLQIIQHTKKLCPLYCVLKKTFEIWHRIIHAEGSTQFTCNQDNIHVLTAQ